MSAKIDPTQADPVLTPASAARGLIRTAGKAALATLMDDPEGWPFASMVIPATGPDISPLLVLSELAQHARNLAFDPRASLLFEGSAPDGDSQATPRITLIGEIRRTDEADSRRRYALRHPNSYLGVLGDFHLYRMEIERAFYIGGFARARRIEPAELRLSAPALAARESHLLERLNQNDRVLIGRIAQVSGMLPGDWRAVGLDPEGIDIAVDTKLERIALPMTVHDEAEFVACIGRMEDQCQASGV